MTLEPAQCRGQRVHFALNRRDAAIGLGGHFRGGRQNRRKCGRRDGPRRRRRGGGLLKRGRSPGGLRADPLPRPSRPFCAQPPRCGDRRPQPLPRQAAEPAKMRAGRRAKMWAARRPAAATPEGWPAQERSSPGDLRAGPLPRPSRRFRARPPRRGDRRPPPLPRPAAGPGKLRAADGRNGDGRRRRRRGGGLLRRGRSPGDLRAGPLPRPSRRFRAPPPLPRRAAGRAKLRAARRAKRRRPAAATPGGGLLRRGRVLVTFEPVHFRGHRVAFAAPPPLPRRAAGPAKLRAARRAKRRRPAAATPGGWPAQGRSSPGDLRAGPLPRPSRRFRAPPPLPRRAAGRAKLRAARRAKRRRPAAATPGGWPAQGRSSSW